MTELQKMTKLVPTVEDAIKDLRARYQDGIVGDMRKLVDTIGHSLYLGGAKRWPEARPIEVISLIGPTGVGKSYGVKKLFSILGGNVSDLLYIDGGVFTHGHEAARLFGAPPGYIGHGEDPIFSSKAIQRSVTPQMPHPFILIDEWDKIHSSSKRTLLNALEEGFVTLGNGQRVSLRGAFMFLTANTGAKEAAKRSMTFQGGVKGIDEQKRASKDDELPELRNRVTQWLWLDALTESDCRELINIEMLKSLKDFKIKTNVNLAGSARTALLERGFSPEWGGRELRRLIQREIMAPLVSLEGESADAITVQWNNTSNVFEFFKKG